MQAKKASTYQAPAVQKAFELLKVVAEARSEITLSELARRVGYSKGSTHGMIRALLQAGAIEQGPRRKGYFLGPAVVELAFPSWNYFRVVEYAQPVLNALRDRIGETVFLGVLSRTRGLIMATAESGKPLKFLPRPAHPFPCWPERSARCFWRSRAATRPSGSFASTAWRGLRSVRS